MVVDGTAYHRKLMDPEYRFGVFPIAEVQGVG